MRRGALRVFALLAILSLEACLTIPRPYPAPTAAEVVAAVRSRGQKVTTLRSELRLSQRTPQGKMRATVNLMAQRGRKLRLDVMSPFDTPLITLVSNGDRFVLVDGKKNRHYHGQASPCNLARLLQVQLDPEDILTILGGSTPIIDPARASLRWDAGVEVLTLEGRDRRQILRLEGQNRRWDMLFSEVTDARGAVLLRLEADGYHTQGRLRLPSSLKVSQPTLDSELEVIFKEQEINIPLPEEAFVLPSANGLPSQYIDCGTPIEL